MERRKPSCPVQTSSSYFKFILTFSKIHVFITLINWSTWPRKNIGILWQRGVKCFSPSTCSTWSQTNHATHMLLWKVPSNTVRSVHGRLMSAPPCSTETAGWRENLKNASTLEARCVDASDRASSGKINGGTTCRQDYAAQNVRFVMSMAWCADFLPVNRELTRSGCCVRSSVPGFAGDSDVLPEETGKGNLDYRQGRRWLH